MKVLSISNSNNTLVVNYLTDLIGKAESFVPLQIKTITNGVETMGISDAAMVLGFPHKQVQHHIEFYTNFCKQKGYSLTSYEMLPVVLQKQLFGQAVTEHLAVLVNLNYNKRTK